jgi:TPR repeat protein
VDPASRPRHRPRLCGPDCGSTARAQRDPRWRLADLALFSIGKVAGMMIINGMITLPFASGAGRLPGLFKNAAKSMKSAFAWALVGAFHTFRGATLHPSTLRKCSNLTTFRANNVGVSRSMTTLIRRVSAGLLLLAFAATGLNAARAADISGYLEQEEARKKASTEASHAESTRASARAGDRDAQYWLGLAYRNGWGTGKDPSAAASWLRESADQGHAEAQFTLGTMYEAGEGVPLNLHKAVYWSGQAADQGLTVAQVNLATLMVNAGVGKLSDAYMWFEIAAASGDQVAYRSSRMLAAKLREDELAQAQVRARTWRPSVR